MTRCNEKRHADLYTQLAEAAPAHSRPATLDVGTYETKTIESVDEEFTGSLLGPIAL